MKHTKATAIPPAGEGIQTYTERAGGMARQARQAACAAAAKHWQQAQAAAGNIVAAELTCLNELRAAGQRFNDAAGREQLLFTAEGREFVRAEILPHMPRGMTVAHIHACVQLAQRLPQPVTSREELAALRTELQLTFQTLGLIQAPRRKEFQTERLRNLFSDFVHRVDKLASIIREVVEEEPMETWPVNKLDEFLDYSRPVKERIEAAEKLRLGQSQPNRRNGA